MARRRRGVGTGVPLLALATHSHAWLPPKPRAPPVQAAHRYQGLPTDIKAFSVPEKIS